MSVIQDGDWDDDGLVGDDDNCSIVYNLDQADSDGDGVGDACDNCVSVVNPGQENTPIGSIDNGQISLDDVTVPNEDDIGDACDDDTDNDGLVDAEESDDSCPYSTSWDSDGDGALDGYEVDNGTDPCGSGGMSGQSFTSGFTMAAGPGDADGDGISDLLEVRGWGTDPGLVDTDGDACPDDKEIVDVDGNRKANVNDVFWVAKAAFGMTEANPALDLDKNGRMGVSDAYLAALNSSLVEGTVLCP